MFNNKSSVDVAEEQYDVNHHTKGGSMAKAIVDSKSKKSAKSTKTEATSKKAASFDVDDLPQNIAILINGDQQVIGSWKEFKSGSLGYNANGKVLIDGQKFQLSCNLVLVGSKPSK